jgi:NADPH:quinone reductase-like Zn-dependent oxidoreductase
MEAAPLNPSDFLFVRGNYGVRPAFPSSVGAEGVGRVAKIGSRVDAALRGKRVLILLTYEQGTWADEVVVPARNLVPISDEADPLQLSMIGINPGDRLSLAEPIRFPALKTNNLRLRKFHAGLVPKPTVIVLALCGELEALG